MASEQDQKSKISILKDKSKTLSLKSKPLPARYFVAINKLTEIYIKTQITQKSQHNTEEQSWRTGTSRLQDLF